MALTEKELESQILDWLNSQPGVFAFKVNTTGIFDPTRKVFRTIKNRHIHRGTSDIIGVKDGIFFAIEVKTPKGAKKAVSNPTPHEKRQLEFIQKIIIKGKGAAAMLSELTQVEYFLNQI